MILARSRTYNNYFALDAREVDTIIGAESVQTIITSPPYFDVKTYEKIPYQIGWNQSYEAYLSDLKSVFEKCFRLTVDTGTLWLIVDTYKREGRLRLLPLEIMRILEGIGWIPQDVIIWDKVKNLPYSRKGQFRNNFEYILLLSKTSEFKYYIDRVREVGTLGKWWIKYPERYNPKGKVPENIWRIPIPVQGSWGNGTIEHLCPFPPELAERIILLSTDEDDLVLDPFAGSGVALAQAKCMKRKFIGCDINENYVDRFHSKVVPEIELLWIDREKAGQSRELMQEQLRNFIIALRKLKYGKVLLKKAMEEFGRDHFELLIVDSNSNNNRRISVVLGLRSSSDLNIGKLEEWLVKQSSAKPLSKYELSSSIKVVPATQLIRSATRANYHCYLEGKFYDKAEGVTLQKVLDKTSYEFPPILSNVEISQAMIKGSRLPYT